MSSPRRKFQRKPGECQLFLAGAFASTEVRHQVEVFGISLLCKLTGHLAWVAVENLRKVPIPGEPGKAPSREVPTVVGAIQTLPNLK